ncbi:glycosyl transferase [Komagataeibacter xylinus]|uniref:Glycosyl transferase n=1 Tax=Komagataeibacter xylinus TaxID=28448 RepID=A0A318PVY6_KOMXY|nr:glycosyl transferase [Komagataeibacter xylinus]AZV39475.1 glycosyl transferase [Komagataeibacter xylinus]PYD57806.1 glycosyl transferase [Komagataeibacter xylinus]GBQ71964.1 glycosyl transferase family protein [Komagataeibacter xylinus NBRC 15237]
MTPPDHLQTPAARRIIVTGCDHAYFELVAELIASIRDHADTAIAVIDCGMTAGQRTALQAQGVRLLAPHIPDYAPRRALAKRPSLAINISKLWLDQMLPDFDLILWLDADTWVQDGQAPERMFAAAQSQTLAIVPEIGAKRADLLGVRWMCPGWMQIRSFLYKNATRARLPFAIRRRIGAKPLLNAGVFCLHRNAPIWPVLRRWQALILPRRHMAFTQDQLCIALAVYIDGLPVTFLDNSHNYIGPWLLDETTGTLANLFFPHAPVGIVHMASQKAMRSGLENTLTIPTVQGGQAAVNLRYGGMRARSAHAG